MDISKFLNFSTSFSFAFQNNNSEKKLTKITIPFNLFNDYHSRENKSNKECTTHTQRNTKMCKQKKSGKNLNGFVRDKRQQKKYFS